MNKILGEAKIVKWILSLIVAFCLGGCERKVMVRITNRSDVEIKNVIVRFPSQTEEHGNIPPNGATDFREVTKAYRYAYVHAVIDGKEVILQPVDYVGEKPLKSGRYTYALTYDPRVKDKYGHLRLECEKE